MGFVVRAAAALVIVALAGVSTAALTLHDLAVDVRELLWRS